MVRLKADPTIEVCSMVRPKADPTIEVCSTVRLKADPAIGREVRPTVRSCTDTTSRHLVLSG
jgi:hypothetical protein